MESTQDLKSPPAPPSALSSEKGAIVFSALVFATGTFLSRILGLFRDMLVARYLSDDVRDAFLNAFRLPNLFRRIFGEGALSSSFVPVYVKLITGDARDSERGDQIAHDYVRAKRLLSGAFTMLLVITVVLSTLAVIFMDQIMFSLLSGASYMSVPGKFELTVRLGRIMFGFLVLITVFGFFVAVLSSLRRFAWAAIAPCFFNLAIILAALAGRRSPVPEFFIAWGVMLGGLLQLFILIPELVKTGHLPRLTFRFWTPEVAKVMHAFLPSAIGVSVLQLTAVVNMRFASELASGSHSYLYLADRILELPLSVFVVSISSALLPSLSALWAAGDRAGMAETINHYVRLIVFVALPAAVGMFVLAQPICEVLFLGREFKYEDAVATAGVIQIYSLLVILSAGVRILAQGFYAIHNTWYPALAGVVALVAHVLFAFALTRNFQLNGLAAASVASAFVNLMMLATAYNAWVGSLEIRRFLRSFVRFVLCSLVMIGVLQAYEPINQVLVGRFMGSRAVALLVSIACGAMAYFLAAYALRVEEFHETLNGFAQRWARYRARQVGES